MMDDPSTFQHFIFYRYVPNLTVAATFVVIFSLSAILHALQIFGTRTWYLIPMVMGGLMEATGYVSRILSHRNLELLGPYLVQEVLLLVAPALYATSIYMIFGRLVVAVDGQQYSLVGIKHLTKVFVSGDILSFLVLCLGTGLVGSENMDVLDLGQYIILAGLSLQIISFGIFVLAAFVFHRRMIQGPTKASLLQEEKARISWRVMIWVIYSASSLVMIRSIFRLIEYGQGFTGYLLRNEVWLYLFDAMLMAFTSGILNWYHPSNTLILDAMTMPAGFELASTTYTTTRGL